MIYRKKIQNIEHDFATIIKFYVAKVVFVFEIFEFWEGKWNIEEKIGTVKITAFFLILLLKNQYTV